MKKNSLRSIPDLPRRPGNSLRSIPDLPYRFLSPDNTSLFAFVMTLRLAVRARVAEEQSRGVSFADIVVQVREMVSRSEDAASHSGPRPSPEFRAISKQAVAWCLEAYRLPDSRGLAHGDHFPASAPA
jgi:hypothetical protein